MSELKNPGYVSGFFLIWGIIFEEKNIKSKTEIISRCVVYDCYCFYFFDNLYSQITTKVSPSKFT